MNNSKKISKSLPPGGIRREDLIQLLNHALSSGNFHFIQTVSREWLSEYTNDITIQCYLARSSFDCEERQKNSELLLGICNRDPENSWAYELLLKNCHLNDDAIKKNINTALFGLGKNLQEDEIDEWGKDLREIRRRIAENGDFEFDSYFGKYIGDDCPSSIIALCHLVSQKKKKDNPETMNIFAERYHQKWPECIAIKLYLADSLMELGENDRAVMLLHECAVMDPGGEIITRHFSKHSEYLAMWPSEMAIQLKIPIPPQIAIPLHYKQIPSDVSPKKENLSFPKEHAKNSLRRIFLNRKNKLNHQYESIQGLKAVRKDDEKDLEETLQKIKLTREQRDNPKKPVYVIMSIKNRLIAKYGEKSSKVISAEIKKLADSTTLKKGWQSVVFFPDDANCMRFFNLDPLVAIDPWKIKLALVDLDKYLGTNKQMIACVLIIGGSDIVPFHSLPNPTDDKDKEVLSDNPYSTLDANYFVPEWPVGRLPGEKTNDPGLLLKQIRQVIFENQSNYKPSNWWFGVKDWFLKYDYHFSWILDFINKPFNYGYTASIWRRSSLAAFRPIGNGNHLRVTPPFDSSNLDIDLLKKSKYAYFNLHGLADSPEWYGQKDISENKDGPDFPTAITAKQLMKSGSVPSIVFSEACYGAYIENKISDESIALKFKDAGNSVFIGSTCIAYGSITTPLTGADLLAFIFWKFIQENQSAGQAFMQAKVSFAKIMMQRQGYLDGEDQKILLSFVYYGDPLAKLTQKRNASKTFYRNDDLFKIIAVSDHDELQTGNNRISGDVLTKIKNDLKVYLPGIDNAEIKIHHDHIKAEGMSMEFGKKGSPIFSSGGHTKISYYHPSIYQKEHHFQYARVTLDKNGEMIKLVMSR